MLCPEQLVLHEFTNTVLQCYVLLNNIIKVQNDTAPKLLHNKVWIEHVGSVTLIMCPPLDQTRNQFRIECSIPGIIFYFWKSIRIWVICLEHVPNTKYIMYAMLHRPYTQFLVEHVREVQITQLFNILIYHNI